ncbi:hypothetical protein HK097_009655, partial [Rhizophlyctis rosea]
DLWVTQEHFEIALEKQVPSVNTRDRKKYELLKVKFSGNLSAVLGQSQQTSSGGSA